MNVLLRAEGGFKHWKTGAVDLSATNVSDAINIFKFGAGSWSVVWTGVVGSAELHVEVSHDDGIHWDDIELSTIITAGAEQSDGGSRDTIPGGLLRLRVASAATSGFATLFLIGKEEI